MAGISYYDYSTLSSYIIPEVWDWFIQNNIKIEIDRTHLLLNPPKEIFYEYIKKIEIPWLDCPNNSTILDTNIYFNNQEELNLFLLVWRGS